MENNRNMDKIIVLDFGSQYSHLICRRIREVNIYCELLPYNTQAKVLKELNPKGIIFSGGPASIYSKDSPKPDKDIFEMNIPILGICYGQQVLIDNFEGTVKRSHIREYGRAELVIDDKTDLFKNIEKNIKCWMSHGDAADKLPKGFKVIAHTDNSFSASIANQQKKF
ncbi:MAG TPA: glutamine-hydrolyzing GMP synthase, partial [Nitrososphaeraceae archaeon]|nr:glutamine-hydrolyzing GMP synthase [Nitrososphaeraceae archaeon]